MGPILLCLWQIPHNIYSSDEELEYEFDGYQESVISKGATNNILEGCDWLIEDDEKSEDFYEDADLLSQEDEEWEYCDRIYEESETRRNEEPPALWETLLAKGIKPTAKNCANDPWGHAKFERWHDGQVVRRKENQEYERERLHDEIWQAFNEQPNIEEVWTKKHHNKKMTGTGKMGSHSSNDTRRLRHGKVLGCKNLRTMQDMGSTYPVLTHVEINGLRFKVGRAA